MTPTDEERATARSLCLDADPMPGDRTEAAIAQALADARAGRPPAERAVVLEQDRARAQVLMLCWLRILDHGTRVSAGDQLGLLGMVTAALADARADERTRLEGEPARPGGGIVTADLRVSARMWPEFEARARRDVRRRWVDELTQQDLRPVSWPAVAVTGWAWPSALEQPSQVDLDSPVLEYVRLTISGPAVPA